MIEAEVYTHTHKDTIHAHTNTHTHTHLQLEAVSGVIEAEVVPVKGETPSSLVPPNDPASGTWYQIFVPDI